MRASGVGIVQQRDVAGSKRKRLERGGHRHRHRAQVHGHMVAHGEDFSRVGSNTAQE